MAILAMATMSACDNLATPVETNNSVEVEMGGGEGSKAPTGGITGDVNVAWVRINVKLKDTGATTGSGDLTKDGSGVWRGMISVSDVGGGGLMTFTATAGTQDASTGVYHVSWAGSNDLLVMASGLKVTIPVSAGDNTRHIFYVNPNSATDNWRYLEAAPSDQNDQSEGIAWWNDSYTTTGATATRIGSGNANTTKIIASQGGGSYSASLCAGLVLGGYDDWFLPSKEELNEMYGKQGAIGSFAPTFYWSSSEDNITDAWFQNFDFGDQISSNKGSALVVRAIRAF